jgi:glutamate carboxypeptidase
VLAACGGAVRPSVAERPREIALGPSSLDDERKIIAAVDASNASHVALWQRVVDINSGTTNLEGVRSVGAIFREQLDKLGFRTRWVSMDETKRAGDLVAERTGAGRRVLLMGHLDTVFDRDSPFQTWTRDGDTITGPGVSDMKGGDVVLLSALASLEQAGVLANTNIAVVMTGDEEKAGSPFAVAKRELIEAARHSDVALSFEPTVREGSKDFATVSRRGNTSWALKVSAPGGHSGLIFGEKLGPGAIFETARILDTFYREVREPNLTFSAGVILGGTKVDFDQGSDRGTAMGKDNVVPESAIVHGDLRALTPDQLARVKEKMRRIVADHLPRANATIEFEDGYPPMAPSSGNRALFARLNEVNQTLGEPPEDAADPMARGAGEIAVVAPFVDALDGLGVSGRGWHAPGETADLSRLPIATKRAALLIYRLTRPR